MPGLLWAVAIALVAAATQGIQESGPATVQVAQPDLSAPPGLPGMPSGDEPGDPPPGSEEGPDDVPGQVDPRVRPAAEKVCNPDHEGFLNVSTEGSIPGAPRTKIIPLDVGCNALVVETDVRTHASWLTGPLNPLNVTLRFRDYEFNKTMTHSKLLGTCFLGVSFKLYDDIPPNLWGEWELVIELPERNLLEVGPGYLNVHVRVSGDANNRTSETWHTIFDDPK